MSWSLEFSNTAVSCDSACPLRFSFSSIVTFELLSGASISSECLTQHPVNISSFDLILTPQSSSQFSFFPVPQKSALPKDIFLSNLLFPIPSQSSSPQLSSSPIIFSVSIPPNFVKICSSSSYSSLYFIVTSRCAH